MTQSQARHSAVDAPRIVVVDSSKVTRSVIEKLLREELDNVEVVSCSTGAEALVCCETGIVDLVTTALRLPDMDGDTLSQKIRSVGQAYMPIIVVSGDAQERMYRRDLSADITDYFDKGMGLKALAAFIQGYIRPDDRVTGRILYVEDSKVVALATSRMLKRNGLEVMHTTTVEEALEMLKDPQGIDLILTDVYLKGGLTGKELLLTIRRDLNMNRRQMPVLVMTGDDNQNNQTTLLRAGANDLVEKPIEERLLINKVRFQLKLKGG